MKEVKEEYRTNFFDFELSGYLAKYVEILGKVCGHTGNGVKTYLLFPKHSYSLTNIRFLEYEHTIYYQSNAWSDEKIGGTTQ